MADEGALICNIFFAAQNCDVRRVAKMLNKYPQLLSSALGGETLFGWGARTGHVSLVRLLLERGADINAPCGMWPTALHVAASNGREEMVSMLLNSGAVIRRRSDGWRTPLMEASESGHGAVVRLLLRSMGGRGLDDRDTSGCTELWCTCNDGYVDVLRILLLAGADHTIADNHGTTPQQIAQQMGHQQCVRLLKWWEDEPQRACILHKARTLHEGTATRQQAPAAPVPAYLSPRVQEGSIMPSVEVRERQQDGTGAVGAAKRGREEGGQEKEEEVCATAGYVVKDLAAELYTELLAGFR